MRDDLISQRYLFAKKYLFIHDIDRDRSTKTEEEKYLFVNNTTPTVYCMYLKYSLFSIVTTT